MPEKFVVFGGGQHVFGLSESSANQIERILSSIGYSVQMMSENQYRHRHGFQGIISTD